MRFWESKCFLIIYFLFSFVSNANGARSALLPFEEPVYSRSTSPEQWSGVVPPRHLTRKTRFLVDRRSIPLGFADCRQDNAWVVLGRDAKMIKQIAFFMGVRTCKNIENLIDQKTSKNIPFGILFRINYTDVFGKSYYLGPSEIKSNHRQLYPHAQSDMCALVHRNFPIQRMITDSFSLDTWVSTGGVFFFFMAALHALGQKNAFFAAFDTFITGGFVRSKRGVVNYVCLLLSIFSLIITNAFSGCFMSFLTVQGEPEQLDTLEMIAEHASIILVPEATEAMFDEETGVMAKLAAKMDSNSFKAHRAMTRVINDPRVVTLGNTEMFDLMRLLPEYISDDGYALTHIAKECISSVMYSAFWVRADWPLADYMDRLVQRMVEGGIPDKLYRDSLRQWSTVNDTLLNVNMTFVADMPRSNDPTALAPKNMVQPTVVLGFGLMASLFAFLWELLRSWRKLRSHRKIRKQLVF